ncbi:SCO family protein [Niveispirillum sp.]|uniref:SCO family protein n=1 Tax=Niveispirillum sp. TaxID=1917217 RepID=UPI001B6C6914|nr:SCO family protein [Niveispirillum sp.]MBP7339245.1 SCO family protein [Niveispirillum sp.]
MSIARISILALTVAAGGVAVAGEPVLHPAFRLVATDGKTVTQDSHRGDWQVVLFGYTYCPDICPTTLAGLTVALRQMGPVADLVKPLFISVDPGRDSKQHLAEYLALFEGPVTGLTGTDEQVRAAATAFGARYMVEPGTGPDDYLISHTVTLFVLDPRGRLVDRFRGDDGPVPIRRRLCALVDPGGCGAEGVGPD